MSKQYITADGYQALKKELDYLWHEKRPAVTKVVTWAAGLGDRSENADYHYNKKLLREIDYRIRFLRKRIDGIQVVPYSPDQEGRVFFGAWVDIENDSGLRLKLRIVGSDEIYDRKDYISIDSPMALGLLRKQIDDEAQIDTPDGKVTWTITAIHYG